MKYNEFIEKYNLEEGKIEEWFIPKKAFENDLKFAGWKLNEHKYLHNIHSEFKELNVICTNPNFYTDGNVIANSRRSIIQSCGQVRLLFEGKQYSNMFDLFKEMGAEVLKDFSKIEWVEIMDWIIVTKKDNILIGQFSEWDELPIRKDVEK